MPNTWPTAVAIGPPLDQLYSCRAIDEAGDAGRPQIERRARLAHEHAVLLAEDEQESCLRRRDLARRLRRHPALHTPLRNAQQIDQPMMPRAGFFISHAKYIIEAARNVKGRQLDRCAAASSSNRAAPGHQNLTHQS
jgi:hypothetical protein